MAISYNGAYGFESYTTTAGTNIGNFTTLTFPLPVEFGNLEAKARNCKVDDEDHNYKYSKILPVKNDCSSGQIIQVYPNPARDKFQVVLSEADDKAAIFIYNMAGQ